MACRLLIRVAEALLHRAVIQLQLHVTALDLALIELIGGHDTIHKATSVLSSELINGFSAIDLVYKHL